MYKIVDAKELTTNIYLFEVEAKRVAKSCLPGQFVIVRTNEDSERIFRNRFNRFNNAF